MYTYVVGRSQNGSDVYTNIITSAAGRYFNRSPYLIRIVKDIVESLNLSEPTIMITRDMGRNIGNTNIVATGEKDTIYYARPPKRSNSLRFVKNRSLAPSSELAVILRRDADGNYEVANVWIGPPCPPFPDADDANQESEAYWRTHALVAGSETIDLQTVTGVCPY
jgi:hypothetical protein